MAHRRTVPGFTFRFGQRVRVLSPHPEAGATGQVVNAYLYRDGREQVFVAVPGGVGRYDVNHLEPARGSRLSPRRPAPHSHLQESPYTPRRLAPSNGFEDGSDPQEPDTRSRGP